LNAHTTNDIKKKRDISHAKEKLLAENKMCLCPSVQPDLCGCQEGRAQLAPTGI